MATKKRVEKPLKKRTVAKRDHHAKKAAPAPARKLIRHVVAVDEARERAEVTAKNLSLETPDGVDEVGEELAETFLEDATGADDAATEHRAENTVEDRGGPFVLTTGATEFADGTDASNPADAEREGSPTVSAHQPR